MNGSDLKNLVNIAALRAVEIGKNVVEKEHFDFAIDRMRVGVGNTSMERDYQE